MSSLYMSNQNSSVDFAPGDYFIPHSDGFLSAPTSAASIENNSSSTPFDTYLLAQALRTNPALCNPAEQQHFQRQKHQIATTVPHVPTPTLLPPGRIARLDSVFDATPSDVQGSQRLRMPQTSMGGPLATNRPLKRTRSHQRTPSASTVASNDPVSPYPTASSYPRIANTDFAPSTAIHYIDQGLFEKPLPTPQATPTDGIFFANGGGYLGGQSALASNAHLAMKGFAIDHHIADDFLPDYYQSSRQSMSSHDSPATPRSVTGESTDAKNNNTHNQQDTRNANPNVSLFRTESQAYQDELYNPPVSYTSTPVSATKRYPDYLSPHRNLITERLQTANLARSASPASAVSRERSPFRDGSHLAPTGDWRTNAQTVGTASGMRRQQKLEAEEAEYAAHRPALQREPTKTISPKDAVLEYTEPEQPSLFQDTIPAGYRQHTGGTESWNKNSFGQPGPGFENLVASSTNHPQMTFRQQSSDDFANTFSYVPLPSENQEHAQIQSGQFATNDFSAPRVNYADANPEFPANLTSMESSISENGPPASSQESYNAPAPQRPADTRAATGTYSCAYHGCTQRFNSHLDLQKHKRDAHQRPQQQQQQQQQLRQQYQRETSSSSTTHSPSPRASESPAPSASGIGLTSAALAARNSQAGPHKCTRINPSTNKPCNTIFSRPYDLTRHEETIHSGRKQKVRCPMCREEKTFSRNDALTRHMRVVHPEVETYGKRGRRD